MSLHASWTKIPAWVPGPRADLRRIQPGIATVAKIHALEPNQPRPAASARHSGLASQDPNQSCDYLTILHSSALSYLSFFQRKPIQALWP